MGCAYPTTRLRKTKRYHLNAGKSLTQVIPTDAETRKASIKHCTRQQQAQQAGGNNKSRQRPMGETIPRRRQQPIGGTIVSGNVLLERQQQPATAYWRDNSRRQRPIIKTTVGRRRSIGETIRCRRQTAKVCRNMLR